jgi:hypothetical protein
MGKPLVCTYALKAGLVRVRALTLTKRISLMYFAVDFAMDFAVDFVMDFAVDFAMDLAVAFAKITKLTCKLTCSHA